MVLLQVIFINSCYDTINYVVILWKRLDDIIICEQNNDFFPYKFIKEIINTILLNSLNNMRANKLSPITSYRAHISPIKSCCYVLYNAHLSFMFGINDTLGKKKLLHYVTPNGDLDLKVKHVLVV